MTPDERERLDVPYLELVAMVRELQREVRDLQAERIVRRCEQPCGDDEEATQDD